MEKHAKQKGALVLLSGGQDSVTCLYYALAYYDKVAALSFDYGQKHAKELEYAESLCSDLQVPFKLISVKGVFGESALTNHELDVDGMHQVNEGLPATFTAGRNMTFLSIACGLAHSMGMPTVITGICQTDFSGYPDCRDSFRAGMEITAQLALDNPDMRILAPLMYRTKAQTWQLAGDLTKRFKELGKEGELWDVVEVVRTRTLTDYNGDLTQNEWGLGKADNPASRLRKKGYEEAKEKGWV